MEKHLKTASFLAHVLDNAFHIGEFRFGLGSLINLIPGVGDVVDAVVSFYIVWIAIQMQIPVRVLFQMIFNILIIFIIGTIPIAGDLMYAVRKVNLRNVTLIKEYAQKSVEKGKILAKSQNSI